MWLRGLCVEACEREGMLASPSLESCGIHVVPCAPLALFLTFGNGIASGQKVLTCHRDSCGSHVAVTVASVRRHEQ
jgi:hypothetical protein